MDKRPIATLAVLIVTAGCGGAAGQREAVPIETEEQRVYYALGAMFARNVGQLTPEQLGAIQQGFEDTALQRPPAVDVAEYTPRVNQMLAARASARVADFRARSEAFLAEAAQEEGAERTESGLVMKTLREGEGASPEPSDRVKVHYRGTLIDGTEFDSSYERGQPAEFQLGGVIACWKEGLQKMQVGGQAKLVCPPDLAYGDRGSPPKIPGGSALVFEVELLEIAS